MPGRRFFRKVISVLALSALGVTSGAIAAGMRAPIRWSTVAFEKSIPFARDTDNRRVELGLDDSLQKSVEKALVDAKALAAAATSPIFSKARIS